MTLGACNWLSRRFWCQLVDFEANFDAKEIALKQYLVPFRCNGGVNVWITLMCWCIWCVGGVDYIRYFQHARPLRGSADMCSCLV